LCGKKLFKIVGVFLCTLFQGSKTQTQNFDEKKKGEDKRKKKFSTLSSFF